MWAPRWLTEDVCHSRQMGSTGRCERTHCPAGLRASLPDRAGRASPTCGRPLSYSSSTGTCSSRSDASGIPRPQPQPQCKTRTFEYRVRVCGVYSKKLRLSLHGILAHGEVGGLLLALDGELGRLLGGKLSPESTRLLGADVKRLVHLVRRARTSRDWSHTYFSQQSLVTPMRLAPPEQSPNLLRYPPLLSCHVRQLYPLPLEFPSRTRTPDS